MPKSIFVSKTFWFNVLTVLVYVMANYADLLHIPAEWAGAFLAMGNLILRMLTGQPVVIPGMAKPLVPVLIMCALGLSGCSGMLYGTYDTQAIQEQQARYNAALSYLEGSLANVQAAAEQAKLQHPENASAIDAQVNPVVAQLQDAVEKYKAAWSAYATPGQNEAWTTARAVLSTAVSVLGPVAINALVTR